jgi:GNAT superfamily N-acetyltransferase
MRIEFLDQHPGLVPTLAAWHHAQWGDLYDHWTLEVAHAELADHALRRSLPTTLVLLEGETLLGSVSLVLEDAPELCDQGSPWLASLYVLPEARGRGMGARLVRAAVATAAEQGVTELFLFTPEHAGFYERLGWRHLVRTALKGTPVDLMQIEPRKALAA